MLRRAKNEKSILGTKQWRFYFLSNLKQNRRNKRCEGKNEKKNEEVQKRKKENRKERIFCKF